MNTTHTTIERFKLAGYTKERQLHTLSNRFVVISVIYCLFVCLCVPPRQQDVVKEGGAEDFRQREAQRPMGEESSERGGPVQTGGEMEGEKFS